MMAFRAGPGALFRARARGEMSPRPGPGLSSRSRTVGCPGAQGADSDPGP
jgi:hypothetical protein